MTFLRVACVCAGAAILSACSLDRFSADGAYPIVATTSPVRKPELADVLDPSGLRTTYDKTEARTAAGAAAAAATGTASGPANKDGGAAAGKPAPLPAIRDSRDLDLAYRAFHDEKYKTPAKQRRNEVSERLIAASLMSCADFKRSLFSSQASVNSILGSAATIFGAIGSMTTEVDVARTLSGTAGIFSGVRAQLNEDFLRNAVAESVTKAIDIEMAKRIADIRRRYIQEVETYPVQGAVSDAIDLSTVCDLPSGLALISTAVTQVQDPVGLRAFNKTFTDAGYQPTMRVSLDNVGPAQAPGAIPEAQAASALAMLRMRISDLAVRSTLALVDIRSIAPSPSPEAAAAAAVSPAAIGAPTAIAPDGTSGSAASSTSGAAAATTTASAPAVPAADTTGGAAVPAPAAAASKPDCSNARACASLDAVRTATKNLLTSDKTGAKLSDLFGSDAKALVEQLEKLDEVYKADQTLLSQAADTATVAAIRLRLRDNDTVAAQIHAMLNQKLDVAQRAIATALIDLRPPGG